MHACIGQEGDGVLHLPARQILQRVPLAAQAHRQGDARLLAQHLACWTGLQHHRAARDLLAVRVDYGYIDAQLLRGHHGLYLRLADQIGHGNGAPDAPDGDRAHHRRADQRRRADDDQQRQALPPGPGNALLFLLAGVAGLRLGVFLPRFGVAHESALGVGYGLSQIRSHLRRGLIAALLVLAQRAHHHFIQRAADLRAVHAHGGGILAHMLERHGNRGFTIEGHGAREHFIHHNAHRIQIALFIRHLAPRLLRREVVHAAHGAAVGIQLGGLGGLQAGNAEIGNLDLPLPVHQYVLGLDIAMNDAVSVGMIHRRKDADGHAQGDVGMNAALFTDHLLEGHAVHVFHHDVAHFAFDAHIQQVHDVFMGHLGGGFGLASEAAHEFDIGFVLRTEHLDGHRLILFQVLGAIHHGHAARADDSFNAIPARYEPSDHL